MDEKRERRLATALREFERIIDSGLPFDSGVILNRYPDVAAELSACLDGLEMLRGCQVADWTRDAGSDD